MFEFEFRSAFADIFRPSHTPSYNGLLKKGLIQSMMDLGPMHFCNRNLDIFFNVEVAILVLIRVLRFVGEKYLINDGVPLALTGDERGMLDLRLLSGIMHCFY